jgi:ribosomal protein S18 acetylase RimI-like enzyme
MIDVRKITIEEFEDKIYDKYITLFTLEEQRDWKTITVAYQNGIEEFYGIYDDEKLVGFFVLERIKNYPYYLDYFAIFNEYQSKGYGSKSVKILLDKIIKDDGLLGEIEQVNDVDSSTIRRWKFYEKLGFKKFDTLFFFNGTTFELIIYPDNYKVEGIELANMLYEYYCVNIGQEETKKSCKIIE